MQKSKLPAAKPVTHDVFVYGTLKKDFPNCDYWFKTGATQIRAEDTLVGHMLLSLGPYPAMLKVDGLASDDFAVTGEVWRVEDSVFKYAKAMEEGAGYSTVEVVTESGMRCKAFTMQSVTPGTYAWDKAPGRYGGAVVVTDRDNIPF